MAPRQTTKTPVNGKKPTTRRQLMTPTKAKMNRPGRKPGRKPREAAEATEVAIPMSAISVSGDTDLTTLLANLTQQSIVQQQAIATQAWLTNEITTLRQQVSNGTQPAAKAAGRVATTTTVVDRPELLAEVTQLRQENADLREKAARLDQMATLLGISEPTTPAPAAKVKGKPGRPPKTPVVAAIEPPPVKIPGKRGPKPKVAAEVRPLVIPVARGTKASILKAAADRDVARTFKSCWPVVFKIEEWNAKNPGRLAKISQTMLNKCGVNFARAKQFVEAHEAIIQRYHNDIGLNKANSGKFNEVYEFVRDSLGKGRRH